MTTRKMVCVVCPVGCKLDVDICGQEYNVHGNKCVRGERYAISEITNPVRTVTTTIRVRKAEAVRVPVKTEKPFPKGKVFELMQLIERMEIEAPVKAGEILLENALDTNINLVSSKTVKSA